jgi:hypothetical protein
MAYVVARRGGSWEIRESRSTRAGPRSRTLATFRTLTAEVVETARARSSRPLEARELRRAALRAGAPVALSASDRAARDLLAALTTADSPRPVLRRAVVAALGGEGAELSDNAQAAARWVTATPRQRADTLRDLLLLADRLPSPRRRSRRFPRVESERA